MVRLTALKLVFVVMAVLVTGTGIAQADKKDDALDRELSKFWGEKRKVTVIQRRNFTKDGRLALIPYVGVIPNDDFKGYITTGVRIEYYVAESFNLELTAGKAFGVKDSDLTKFLQSNYNANVTIPQQLDWNFNLNGTWAPFYGKLGFLRTKILHIDFNLSVGVSGLLTRVVPKADASQKKIKFVVAGNVGAGLRLFILNWFGIRIDYRHYIHAKFTGGVGFPAEISLGFQFFVTPERK
ncbi:MAG: outer membrane beta-barrel domain-containing protein [Myxococcales bacterium]|nr:outer membrane beta-barrel domain-containing protein [Myxococcales bacterium]